MRHIKGAAGRMLVAAGFAGALSLSVLTSAAQAEGAAPGKQPDPPGVGTLSCDHNHSNKNGGRGEVDTSSGAHVRTGPHTSCTSVGLSYPGQSLTYHCWVWPDNEPESWTWVSRSGTNGWIRDDLLSGYGADVDAHC